MRFAALSGGPIALLWQCPAIPNSATPEQKDIEIEIVRRGWRTREGQRELRWGTTYGCKTIVDKGKDNTGQGYQCNSRRVRTKPMSIQLYHLCTRVRGK